ncbi:MAG: FAD-dependent oxidoreductase [Burkholderiaceae bacterium]|nr:FAD-dependent oxidoreductase [Burkholderiaceae bacterium]
MNPIIVIGAGLAGWTTVREFRKLDATTPILMITADSGDFYAKPTLSNAFAQKKTPAQLVVTPMAKMVETQGVTMLAHTRVLGFDPYVKTVTTAHGSHDFSALVLATGASPIRIPMGGDAADEVLSVNSLQDFASFYLALNTDAGRHEKSADSYENNSNKKTRVLIMGAGLIGCEFANDLINAGFAVCVIDPSTRPLAALLPESASEQLRASLAGLGVDWHFGVTVQTVNRTADTAQPAPLQATLSNGKVLAADVVLSAIGLRADTQLALAAGLTCERGIVVDTALQTSAPQVYALGDAAQYASAGHATLPFVMPIMNAARALAATLAGRRTELVFPIMPVAVKTPALPLLIASPRAGAPGAWRQAEPGWWQHIGEAGRLQGFILAGVQTARRAEQVKALQAV